VDMQNDTVIVLVRTRVLLTMTLLVGLS